MPDATQHQTIIKRAFWGAQASSVRTPHFAANIVTRNSHALNDQAKFAPQNANATGQRALPGTLLAPIGVRRELGGS